ncbi:DNA damage-regulated autophagy modulator protein 2 isoform X1 [Python bivittatus]|uniref:DNA damage-regulated autophagy modulator protein 2 isoform X1 n=1 Tax=Python bivittatus TaxID=176946 RepID=A0A9F2KW70_PYTBI|nr:DNA damage-regulated autophagy modulator protein 2 isoform X1 [Python bivittatus]XP_025022690.1 DNA damage-regulated autophagy modulator protein 2 isoform X1 [Python bivittatus]
MWWFQQGLSFLPSALVICSSASFVFPYVIGVLLYHVDPLVPYISDTGAMPPERCLFGIMLSFVSFLGMATMYVRYKQVSALNPEEPKMLRLNKAGLVIGMVSCLGICIIANFQKNVIRFMHSLGAFLTFGIGIIYILVQTIISYKMQPQIHGKDIFWIRLTILLWCTVSTVSMSISSFILLNLNGIDSLWKQHWDPQEKGYVFHIISTISEWSLASSVLSFFLTFIRDFQKISLHTETSLLGPNLYYTQEQLLPDDQGMPITGSI